MTANSQIKKYVHKDGANEINVPHLYIDVATGTFLVRVYHDGVTRSRSLGTKSFGLAKLKTSSAIKDILSSKQKKRANKLIEDYYPEYITHLEDEELADATLIQRDISWRLHVEPFWGKLSEHDITQANYSEFIRWHRKEKGGDLFNHLKLVRGLFAFMRIGGAKFELIEVTLPKKEADNAKAPKGTFIEPSEIKDILEAESLNQRERLMIRMAYTFGFRIGELVNLKKDRVKKLGGQVQIHLKIQDTKTRAARIVPLTQDLGDELMEVMKLSKGEPVFPMVTNFKRPMSKQVMDRAWLQALKDAGIRRRIRFHDLRHTAATNFADLGIDPVKACAILGMSLKIYMSVYVKRQSLNFTSVVEAIEKSGGSK